MIKRHTEEYPRHFNFGSPMAHRHLCSTVPHRIFSSGVERACFRDGESVASEGAEASTASKKLAARSCTRSAGVKGARARKMRRQAHPSFA